MIRELEFKLLCRRHADDVYRYARSLLSHGADAEDATQEVLLRLWKHLPSVQFRQTRAWLLRTTRNYCIDQIRRRSRGLAPMMLADGGPHMDSLDESAMDPSIAADSDTIRNDVERALAKLPENLRSAFVLYEIHGLRYREIAETLECPINSVKAYLSVPASNCKNY